MLILVAMMLPLTALGQDVIVKKDGSTILSKVLEVNIDNVKYKKFSNQNGPTYTINKADLLSKNYENGDKDKFDDYKTPQATSNDTKQERAISQRLINKPAASNNATLIKKYQGDVIFAKTAETKDSKTYFPIFAISDSSIISTEDIEMRFIPTFVLNRYGVVWLAHSIELKNKTDRIIYIDKGSTFIIESEGKYASYYDTEQTTVAHGKGSGVGVGLGGIASAIGVGGILGTLANSVSVGSSSQSTIMKTYTKERILAIPPHAQTNLTDFKQIEVKKNKYETVSDIEHWYCDIKLKRGDVKKNGHIAYDESNTPNCYRYILTYSTSQYFDTYSTLNAKVYVRYIVGGYYNNYDSNAKKIIKKLKEYISNFWDDEYILVGSWGWLRKE